MSIFDQVIRVKIYCILFLLVSISSKKTNAQCNINFRSCKNAFKKKVSHSEKLAYLDSLDHVFNHCWQKDNLDSLAHGWYFLARRYRYIKERTKALAYDKKALALRQEILPKNDLLTARSLWGLAQTAALNDSYEDAIKHLSAALDIHFSNKTERDSVLLARTHRDLGSYYRKVGEFQASSLHDLTSADIYFALGDLNNYINLLHHEGILKNELRLFDSSLVVLERVQVLLEANLATAPKLHEEYMPLILLTTGNAHLGNKDYQAALASYEKIIQFYKKDIKKYVEALENVGNCHEFLQNFELALKYQQKVLRLKQELDTHFNTAEIARSYKNIGDVYFAKKEAKRALQYYHQAINLVVSNADHSHYGTIIGPPAELLISLNYKAKAQLQLDETQAALATYREADRLIDLMRREHREEGTKLFWRKTTRSIYSAAIETAFKLGNAEAAFFFMEKSKAVLLADALNERQAKEKANIPKQTLAEIRQLQQALTTISNEDRDNYIRQKDLLTQRINALEKNYPAYFQFKYELEVADITAIRNILQDSAAFLAYFVGEEYLFSITIDKNEVHLNKIAYNENDLQDLTDFLTWSSNPEIAETRYTDSLALKNKRLTQKLWHPVPNIKHYTISPDGFLNYLNFEMLSTVPSQYLIKNHGFNYAYSATVLLYASQEKSVSANQFLGIAPVHFQNYAALEGSLQSLNAIHKYIEGDCLTKAQANKPNLLEKLQNNWRIVHFDTHAQGDSSPIISLADAPLSLAEIYPLNLAQTELAMLSACETSLGNLQEGEGVMSIARAFTYAGAQCVIASQWKAQEKATALLLCHFYQNISLGMRKDEALRQAKLYLIEQGHPPADWAAFVSIGNAEAMKNLKGGFGLSPFWLLLILLPLAGGLVKFGGFRQKGR